MKEFTKADYEVYPGSENFRDGEEPMIHTLKTGLDIIADASGVHLSGYVGTRAIWYTLYKSATRIKKSVECAANEWIKDLEPLNKYEQLNLLYMLGILQLRR